MENKQDFGRTGGWEFFDESISELYRIARNKNQTVADVLSTCPLNISLRRALVGGKLSMWTDLVSLVVGVNMVEEEDRWEWKVGKHHVFSVKSMYRDIVQAGTLPDNCVLWKLRVPLRLRSFYGILRKV